MVSQVVSMINSLYEGASTRIRALIDQFNEKVAPKLDAITHDELGAIPVLSSRLTTDQTGLGLMLLNKVLTATYSINQLPITIARQFASGGIQNFNGLFG